jgi:hypothetical protein
MNREEYIDIFLKYYKFDKHVINVKNNKNFYHFKKYSRAETKNFIIWDLFFEKNTCKRKIIYNRDNHNFTCVFEENYDYINMNFLDNEWLKSKNLYFKMEENLCNLYIDDGNLYILETKEPLYIFIFLFNVGINFIFEICEKIERNIKYKDLKNYNFVDKFFDSCENLGKNKFSCKTENKEIGNVDKVIFEYDKNIDRTIEDNQIIWKIYIIYKDISREIKTKRYLIFDLYIGEFIVNTDIHQKFNDISYLFEEWREKNNARFKNDEFFIFRNGRKLEDRIFRLKTRNEKYAMMTFLGANYEFLCEI